MKSSTVAGWNRSVGLGVRCPVSGGRCWVFGSSARQNAVGSKQKASSAPWRFTYPLLKIKRPPQEEEIDEGAAKDNYIYEKKAS